MQVLFVRHGAAVDPHVASGDVHRWLTAAGRQSVDRVGAALLEHGFAPTDFVTSPLVRAVQTTERLAQALGHGGEVEVEPSLAPGGGTTAQTFSRLSRLDPSAVAVVVGHEPSIRVLAAQAAGLRSLPGFRTSSGCLVSFDDRGVGSFEWWIDPQMLRLVRDLNELGQ